MAVVGLSGHWEGEFRVRRKDGSTFPGFVSDAVIRSPDGSIAGYVGVTADLSAQKEIEESLRRSERNYRRIVETAAEGIWIIDTEGRTTFANPRMASMLGYTVEEMQKIGVFDVVFPEDEPVARKSLARRQEGISETFEFRLRRRDGGEIWARVSARPLHDENGRSDRARCACSPISPSGGVRSRRSRKASGKCGGSWRRTSSA